MTVAIAAAVLPVEPMVDGLAREPASVARRAVARLIDFAVGVVMFVGSMLLFALAAGRPDDGTGVLLMSIAATFIAYLLYEVVLVAVWGVPI